jgi:hypothetical protein
MRMGKIYESMKEYGRFIKAVASCAFVISMKEIKEMKDGYNDRDS